MFVTFDISSIIWWIALFSDIRSNASGFNFLTERRTSWSPRLAVSPIPSSCSFALSGAMSISTSTASIPTDIPVKICPSVSWISLARRFLSFVSPINSFSWANSWSCSFAFCNCSFKSLIRSLSLRSFIIRITMYIRNKTIFVISQIVFTLRKILSVFQS